MSGPVTALFTSRPERKAQGLKVAAGPRTGHSLPRLVAGECGPELSEGGQALPTSSDGFWPQQVLSDGQQGS